MKPERKVLAGGMAGALSSIAVWAVHEFSGVIIPADIALAVYTVFLFGLQYAVPNSETPPNV